MITEPLPRLVPPVSKKSVRMVPGDPDPAAPDAQALRERLGLRQIIDESPALLEQIERVPRFAQSGATVLIAGESGTGKEVFARALHYLSGRAGGPFVPVNCGALPEHLIESEIFGHKRGAFTGALADQ